MHVHTYDLHLVQGKH